MPMRSTYEISTQIILLKIDGFLKGWLLNITPLKDETHVNAYRCYAKLQSTIRSKVIS